MKIGHALAQGEQALDRKIVLFVGMPSKGLDYGFRHGKGGLAEAEAHDISPLTLELCAEFVDGQGGRWCEGLNPSIKLRGSRHVETVAGRSYALVSHPREPGD
jgi:hypothetical protein